MELDSAIIEQLALGIIPPGLAGTLLFAALWWKRTKGAQHPEPALWKRLATPAALGAVYVGLHAFLFGLKLPPKQGTDWLAISAAVTAIVAAFLGLISGGRGDRTVRIALAAAVAIQTVLLVGVGWLAAGNLRNSWSVREGVLTIAAYTIAGLAASLSGAYLARRRPGPIAPVVLLIFAAGASQVLALSFSSLKLAQSAGIWASMLGGGTLVAIFRPRASLVAAGTLLPVVVTLAALYQGVLYTSTERPWLSLSLVALSPVLGAVGAIGTPGHNRHRIIHFGMIILPVVLALLPVAAAMGLALAGAEPDYDYGE